MNAEEQPHADCRYSCGHMETVWLIGTTDYERTMELAECRSDLCLKCLAGVLAKGGVEGLLEHRRQLTAKVAMAA